MEFHPSGSVIGSANTAGCVKLYDLRTTSLYQHYATHTGPVNMVKFHPKGNFMLTASSDSTMKVDFKLFLFIYFLYDKCIKTM